VRPSSLPLTRIFNPEGIMSSSPATVLDCQREFMEF